MNVFKGLDLSDHRIAFNRVGWFTPPYLQLGFLTEIKDAINADATYDQHRLETTLRRAYTSTGLAAMVCERYPLTPHVKDYAKIIAEAVETHFLGLDHVAVAGLMPVVEGAARKIAAERGVTAKHIEVVFTRLIDGFKREVCENGIGAVDEVVRMLESFQKFITKYFYESSPAYALDDKTNRHGTLHGAFSDEDYGAPINFYKTISAVDFLCFIVAPSARLSWLAPDPTPRSMKLAAYYTVCTLFKSTRSA